jgi:hypothetical protein
MAKRGKFIDVGQDCRGYGDRTQVTKALEDKAVLSSADALQFHNNSGLKACKIENAL